MAKGGEFMKRFDATSLRRTILDMAYSGATVHIGCAFSIVEILAVLYRNHLRFDPADLESMTRDYMVLSKGHGVMAQYACLRELGVLSADDIGQYFGDGTRLKGLADVHVPGVEATTGSLGHGLSVAAGLALAARLRQSKQRAFALVGDGELNEGSIWEAVMFAAQFKLDNIVILVDENGFQAMGTTDEVMSLGSIQRKFEAFDCEVLSVDGHDELALDEALTRLLGNADGRPKVLVAKTVKGKGVSFMENDNAWHYTRLKSDTYAAALAELGGEKV
ncbi:MAG: transketolase [Rhodocyclales bacterium]|nr:transketolase [Rhodocyclales bacterium]